MTYLTVGLLLAEETNRGPDYGKASPVGLLVVLLLVIGVFFLVRSMNRHLKRVPQSFESGPGQPAESADPGAATEPDAEIPPRESAG
ncbi:MAG: hypothetical protein K8R24_06065 [Mycobacterium sp.]|nr:hypothetical protein [Mycobacterium sp.]